MKDVCPSDVLTRFKIVRAADICIAADGMRMSRITAQSESRLLDAW